MRLSCAHCACPKFVLGGQLGLDWVLARSQFTLALIILGVTCTFVWARLIKLERLRLLWLATSLRSFAVQLLRIIRVASRGNGSARLRARLRFSLWTPLR